jgi:competence protein ComEC
VAGGGIVNQPAVLLLVVYGAGLATGLLRFGDWRLVAVALPVLVLCRRRPAVLWGVVALVGWGEGAWVARQESGQCAVALKAGNVAAEARLVEPVTPDSPVARLALSTMPCRGPVDARWPQGTEESAGSLLRVRGRWIPRPDQGGRAGGILLIREWEVLAVSPSQPERLRNWLAGTIRDLYGPRAGTVDALVVNRRGAMAPELRDRYARAGLVHILSISGFHVGVIIAWVVLAGRLAGISLVRAGLVAAAIAFAYVAFLGWPPPAARAALLAGLAAQLHWRQRHPQVISLLAVAALLVIVLDPWAVLNAGAWLSVAALAGAVVATRWAGRAVGGGWWVTTLAASVGATLATAPITAALFGMVSLAGVAVNFVAIPLAALAVPGILLSLLAVPVAPPLAPALAAGTGALLGLLDQVAWWAGAWPAGTVVQPVELWSAVPWIAALAVAGWSVAGGTTRWEWARRSALGVAAGVWLLLAVESHAVVRDAGAGLTLHFLDVGQGDAAAVRTPAGRWILIDAGPRTERSDAGRSIVAPFLARHRAGGLAVAVVSHAHADHLGGLPAVMDRIPTAWVLDPAALVADSLYLGFLDQVESGDIRWQPARDGQSFLLDSVRVTVLHPDTAWSDWGIDLNEDSVVLLLEYGRFRALFGGDAGLPAEARLSGRIGPVDLLKVGHHGSRSATGEGWLRELSPRVAVISSGARNRYGHPHPETVARLARHGVAVWRTDEQGTITVVTDGRTMRVRGRRASTLLRVDDDQAITTALPRP